jgi:hypothetical protein
MFAIGKILKSRFHPCLYSDSQFSCVPPRRGAPSWLTALLRRTPRLPGDHFLLKSGFHPVQQSGTKIAGAPHV